MTDLLTSPFLDQLRAASTSSPLAPVRALPFSRVGGASGATSFARGTGPHLWSPPLSHKGEQQAGTAGNPLIREPITAAPNGADNWAIYRAQSLLTEAGKVGPILTPRCAMQVLAGITRI